MLMATSRLSKAASRLQPSPIRALFALAQQPRMISLAGGWPATELLDLEGVVSSMGALDSGEARQLLQYGATVGEGLFEEGVRHWLRSTVDLDLPFHKFVATTGAQQAIDLVARTVVEPGDVVVVEAPSYPAAFSCFRAAGATLREVPSDQDGMSMAGLEDLLQTVHVKAVYVVPCFGNPTGMSLSAERRARLAELSAEHGFYVIEDDPYAALSFSGEWARPVASKANEADSRSPWAIYISSFSKILGPGLRAGFALLPQDVGVAVERLKQTTDIHSARWGHMAVARYLSEGRAAGQIETLRSEYARRCAAMCDSISATLEPLGFSFSRPQGGMFIWGRLPRAVDVKLLLDCCIKQDVIFLPGSAFFSAPSDDATLRLSFAAADASTIDLGIRRIGSALADLLVS